MKLFDAGWMGWRWRLGATTDESFRPARMRSGVVRSIRPCRYVLFLLVGAGLIEAGLVAARLPHYSAGTRRAREAGWATQVRQGEKALAYGDLRAAERALDVAYLMAIESQRWEAMLDVGNGYRHLIEAGDIVDLVRSRAFRAYWAATTIALRQGSREGLLRAADAYESLGDAAMATEIVTRLEHVAARTGGPQATALVRVFRERLLEDISRREGIVQASAP